MAAVTYESLELGAVDSGEIVLSTEKASAFLTQGRSRPLPLEGYSFPRFSGVVAQGLGEGEEKIASGQIDALEVIPGKIVATTVFTDEVWNYSETAADAIFVEHPNAVARTYDLIVAGLAPKPAKFTAFSTFAEVTNQVAIPTGAAASVGMDDATGSVKDGVVTGAVLTTAMFNYLKRQRDVNGQRVFEIDGDINGGTIEGVPYSTIFSATPIGFLGNFENLVVNAQPFAGGDNGSAYRVKNAGSIKDSAGVTHNLTSENKTAVFFEELTASGILDVTSFVKIVPAPTAS